MQQSSRVFFLFACLKACFRLSLSTRIKEKRTITSKKHAYRPETSYVLYYSLKLAPSGKRGSLGLEWLEGLLYQTPGTFSQHTLPEALIVTGGSPPYFGEQYRDLLLYLYRKLDENNSSNQQVRTAVQQYIQTVLHDSMQSCGIKFCTFCCSPPRRGAPRRDVWKAESPTKRLCVP